MPSNPEFIADASDIDFLVSAILKSFPSESPNPPRGALCALSFVNAIDQVYIGARPTSSGLDSHFTYSELRKRHPSFLNALASFALGMKSVEEIKAIEKRFPPCRCNLRISRIECIHIDRPTFLPQLADGLFDFLKALASIPAETLARSLKEDRKPRSKRGDAFKDGSRYIIQETHTPDTIHASFCWYKATKHRDILHFIIRCCEKHPASFRAATCAPEGQEFLSMVTSDLYEEILKMQQNPSTITMEALKASAWILVGFLKALLLDLRPFDRPLVHPCETILRDVANTFFIEMYDTLDSSKKELLTDLGFAQILAGITLQTISNLPNADKITSHFLGTKQVRLGTKQPYVEGWMALSTIRDSTKCANPSCGISPDGHRFSKCARCGVPSYCSRQCQMAAWSLPECPHRSVCKDWAILMKNCPRMDVLREVLASQPRSNDKYPDGLKTLVPYAALEISESRMVEIEQHFETFFRLTGGNPVRADPEDVPRTGKFDTNPIRRVIVPETGKLSPIAVYKLQEEPNLSTPKQKLPVSSSASESLPRLRGMFNKPASK